MSTKPLTPDHISDLVASTLSHHRRKKWIDISQVLTRYVGQEQLFRNKRVLEDGGDQVDWTVQVSTTTTARATSLFSEDLTEVKDLIATASIPWVMQTVNWTYDENEKVFNKGYAQLVDYLNIREHAAETSLIVLLENQLWGVGPISGSTDDPPARSIPWWIPQSATKGFYGIGATGWTTDKAGINPTANAAWRNWTDTYSQVTRDDFVQALRDMAYETNFMPPHDYAELGKGNPDLTYCTTYGVTEKLDRLTEGRNDNLGVDFGKYQGKTMYQGAPFIPVPHLTKNTSNNPIYQLDWNVFRPVVQKGINMKRTRPIRSAKGHTMWTVHKDHSQQYILYNPRCCGVMYAA